MEPHYLNRIANLRAQLANQAAPNFLITNLVNIRYLTGFGGSSAVLLVADNDIVLVSDGRYETQLVTECPGLDVIIRPIGTTMTQSVTEAMNHRFAGDFVFEQNSIPYKDFLDFTEKFDAQLVGCKNVVEELRAVKDAVEIDLIRQSIAINERVFQEISEWVDDSTTERAVAAEIEYRGRRYGAEGCSFEPIVAVGENSALCHYRPGNVPLKESPFTLMDWGLFFGGYASDLTRVLRRGEVPSRYREIYDVTLAAQKAAIEAIKPGVELKTLDGVARSVIEDAGFGDQFTHSLGHGIGLEIHEGPSISQTSKGVLKSGMVITIEPGIYIAGFGGVRIEDDVLVTDDGGEVLSGLDKSFL